MVDKLKIIEHTINLFEGGYSDHKEDKGGKTNWGITEGFYSDMTGTPLGSVDIKSLSRQSAVECYIKYWGVCQCDSIPDYLQHIYFDICINSGKSRAVKIFQRALINLNFSVFLDGRLGPKTIEALNNSLIKYTKKVVMKTIVNKRIDFYKAIVDNDYKQSKFLKGWENRANWFLTNEL